MAKKRSSSYFTPILDSRLPKHLKTVAEKWRRLASSLSYFGPVAWKVKAGFTLKLHAPQAGPCVNNFANIQDRKFYDKPTKDGFVFWIPRLLPESIGKNMNQQVALLSELRLKYGLPEHHLSSFGTAALIAGLVLAHHKATGERVPFDFRWARTDTCSLRMDGRRIVLSFGTSGLHCSFWYWAEGRDNEHGVFVLGLEIAS